MTRRTMTQTLILSALVMATGASGVAYGYASGAIPILAASGIDPAYALGAVVVSLSGAIIYGFRLVLSHSARQFETMISSLQKDREVLLRHEERRERFDQRLLDTQAEILGELRKLAEALPRDAT